MSELTSKHCKPCEGGVTALDREAAHEMLSQVEGWTINDTATEISREFKFKDFLQAMAFANAVGWTCDCEGHHPDLELTWGRCRVRFSTHSLGGLSENDFICAAKVNALDQPSGA